jgi:hypothetical protein
VSGGCLCRGCWFFGFCVFGCVSVVVEGSCVRDCRGLRLCKVGIVGWSVGDEGVGERVSLVTGWGRMGGEVDGWERVGKVGQNELLGGSNGF